MVNLSNANFIKALLIDFLISENQRGEFIIGSEFLFGKKKRFTDLLFVENIITSYEIKADNDDFRLIREQLDDYKKVFDQLFLVITEKHLKKAFSIIKQEEGLILIRDDLGIEIIKSPSVVNNQVKIDILETIPIKFLQSHFDLNKKNSAQETRALLQSIELEELKMVLMKFIKSRLEPKNKLFFSERGCITHFEDIKLLSSPNYKLL